MNITLLNIIVFLKVESSRLKIILKMRQTYNNVLKNQPQVSDIINFPQYVVVMEVYNREQVSISSLVYAPLSFSIFNFLITGSYG